MVQDGEKEDEDRRRMHWTCKKEKVSFFGAIKCK